MSGHVIELLTEGARLNQRETMRNGNMLCFPGEGDLIVAGDLHNHQRNFERIQTVAALDQFPHRHVILQELIHGGILGTQGEDRSLDMLLDAVAWAREYPGRVHFLMANHDLAQVQGQAIMKDGYDLTDRFTRYMKLLGGGEALAQCVSVVHFDHAAGVHYGDGDFFEPFAAGPARYADVRFRHPAAATR